MDADGQGHPGLGARLEYRTARLGLQVVPMLYHCLRAALGVVNAAVETIVPSRAVMLRIL